MTTLCQPMTRRIALLTTALALALSAPAAAQTNPFGPLPQPAPTETAVPTVAKTDDNNTGRTTLFIIGGALVVGFAIMGWFITRDARGALPKEELAALERLRDEGPHAHKQKAARKHNRPRRR
jgi:hypothetical protein